MRLRRRRSRPTRSSRSQSKNLSTCYLQKILLVLLVDYL